MAVTLGLTHAEGISDIPFCTTLGVYCHFLLPWSASSLETVSLNMQLVFLSHS